MPTKLAIDDDLLREALQPRQALRDDRLPARLGLQEGPPAFVILLDTGVVFAVLRRRGRASLRLRERLSSGGPGETLGGLNSNLSERVEEIRAMGSGSTYPEVSRGKFREFEVLLPRRSLASAFDEQAARLLKQIRLLKQQNQKLRAARDLLLPRLMGGEIAV